MNGWIKLHRRLQGNPIWTCERFTRGQAWIDLLLLANHEYGYFYLRDHKVEVDRGQVGWSELKLSKRWKWSRSKIKKFLNDLEKEQQIIVHKSHSTSIITIVNYEYYQQEEQLDEQQKDNRKTTERQLQDTNKKNKEEKEEKEFNKKSKPKKVLEKFIKPTINEISDYCSERKNGIDPQGFYDYYQSKGWNIGNTPMKDWKAAVRTWERNNKKFNSYPVQKHPTENSRFEPIIHTS